MQVCCRCDEVNIQPPVFDLKCLIDGVAPREDMFVCVGRIARRQTKLIHITPTFQLPHPARVAEEKCHDSDIYVNKILGCTSCKELEFI